MPIIHERSFRIRHYECDAFGHLNNVSFLRFMQETAYDASAAVGYDMVCYENTGTRWFIRETHIEYLAPVYYGDTVIVRSWVRDFHRVRSIRAYEMFQKGSGKMVARAWSDWVYIEADRFRPITIPMEMKKAFVPEWTPELVIQRKHFPKLAPKPNKVFITQRKVEWQDLDPINHVNNSVYLTYIQECLMHIGETFGWSLARCQREGFFFLPRSHHIEYRTPALMGDTIEISTWLSNVRRSTLTRHFEMRRISDHELLAQDRSMFVAVDANTLLPIRIPQALVNDFATNISTEDGDEIN
jgi:acyl-CoA thioester hydrolase